MAESSSNTIKVLAPGRIRIMKWKVRKGSKVSQGALLGFYKLVNTSEKPPDEENICNIKDDDTVSLQKLKSSHVGTVLEVVAQEGQDLEKGMVVIHIEACTHPTVMKDMCADCGADLRNEMGVSGDRKETVSATVAMVHSIPELIVSEEQALELGRADEIRLKNTRKLVLLVDLDQTLIHTTNDDIPPNLKGVHHFQLRHGMNLLWYHTRLRPHTLQFLENISKLYELHICTFGVRMYAHTITRFIDPAGKFFSHRILSRDECFNAMSKTANLKALFPCGDSMVCIIDDREDVWNYAPNLIHVKPYRFFQGTADINAPPGLSKKENDSKPITHRVRRISCNIDEDEKDLCVDDEEDEKKDNDGASEDQNDPKRDLETESDTISNADNGVKNVGKDGKTDTSVAKTKSATVAGSDVDDANAKTDACSDVDDTSSKASACSDVDDASSKAGTCSDVDDTSSKAGTCSDVDEASAKTGKIQTKPSSEEKNSKTEENEEIEWDDEDDYLFYLEEILNRIHKAYFDISDQLNKNEGASNIPDTNLDLKAIIPYVRRKVLQGCNICFSGIIPLNMPIEKSRPYNIAKSLGANIHLNFIPYSSSHKNNYTTHLIANKLGTTKVHAAKRSQMGHIVTLDWLWVCCERWERVDERLFQLSEKIPLEPRLSRMNLNVGMKRQNSKSLKRKCKSVDCDVAEKKLKQDDDDDVDEDEDEDDDEDDDDDDEDDDDDDDDGVESSEDEDDAIEIEDDDDDDIFDEEIGAIQKKVTEKGKESSKNSNTRYNPLYSFSDEERASMDKELEELMGEDDSDSDEKEAEAQLRKQVLLDRKPETSSDESLSGEFPLGWKSKQWRKRRSQKKKVVIKREESEDTEKSEESTEGTCDKFTESQVVSECSSSSNLDSEYDSIGSVDEEIAKAVEQKFLER
ncbi:RNA polymerase II subunit A C-terminal domain phosphatase-like [Octopus vulgaris]|uniref:RNA polymerase II subunit A C-terminal domain phosphatase n=1 Tax=Octopus vulgaris TaxID=6645 RepID=A0AA36AQY4_OCTVU|nr:RNA polymerase II subunit A C-terminal domain phosphatase-like [Octopus vulgaris]